MLVLNAHARIDLCIQLLAKKIVLVTGYARETRAQSDRCTVSTR
jgi:hypothetical protein